MNPITPTDPSGLITKIELTDEIIDALDLIAADYDENKVRRMFELANEVAGDKLTGTRCDFFTIEEDGRLYARYEVHMYLEQATELHWKLIERIVAEELHHQPVNIALQGDMVNK